MRILHLSDLHFREKTSWDREPILKGLITCVAALDPKPDLVVVSGDVAYSGKTEEYQLAEAFLGEILAKTELSPKRLYLVPGNHDVDRKARSFGARSMEKGLLEGKSQDDLAEVFNGEDAETLLKRHQAYQTFANGMTERRDEQPYWARLVTVAGLQVGLAGLCSSLLCGTDEDRGRLVLGRFQVNELLGQIEGADLRLALLHHPQDYLAEWDRESWDQLTGKCHMILRGHLHEERVLQHTEGNWSVVIAAAGSAYQGGSHPQGFQLYDVDRENWQVVVTPYRYERNRWFQDRNLFADEPEGRGRYKLAGSAPKGEPTRRVPEGAETLLAAYRKGLKYRYEMWDLGTMGAASTRENEITSVKLEQMYQPLRIGRNQNHDITFEGQVLGAAEILARRQHLIVRGVAGSGKTTWLRKLFRELLVEESALPLSLELRALSGYWTAETKAKRNPKLLDFLVSAIDLTEDGWDRPALERQLADEKGPRPILLVDGWDELGDLGRDVREHLLKLRDRYPRLLVVATSRPYGTHPPTGSDGYEELDLQALNGDEVKAFANRFFEICHGNDVKAGTRASQQFLASLEASQGAQDLTRTPLLLTMMLFIGRGRVLPDKRLDLYEACVDNLIHDLPAVKQREGVQTRDRYWFPQDKDDRLRTVARLAWQMQTKGYGGRSAQFQVVKPFEEWERLLPADWKTDRARFLNWLVERAGLLVDRSDGSLAFGHLSFQEYLTALHLHNTVEGDTARITEFRERVGRDHWWETLRLWAALEDRRGRDRSDALAGDDDLFWLAGALFADGLGGEAAFESWAQKAVKAFAVEFDELHDRVIDIWRNCRQDIRRQRLQEALGEATNQARWLPHTRLCLLAEKIVTPTEWLVSANHLVNILNELRREGELIDEDRVALSRCLNGGIPSWPMAAPWLWLRLWPGLRCQVGTRLQNFAVGGVAKNRQNSLRKGITDYTADMDEQEADDLARYLARDLARDFAPDLARDLARYFARDFARYLAGDLAGDFARDFARYFARYLAGDFAGDFAPYFARDFAPDFAPDLARDFARYFAPDFGLKFSRFARKWLEDHALDNLNGAEDLFALEFFCFGRPGPRAWFANQKDLPKDPIDALFVLACHLSCHPESDPEPLQMALAQLPQDTDPLWPALARHLARQASNADRQLLNHYARHPGAHPDERTRWGLRYLVRGDVLFEDGEVVTLDELCDQLDLPHLPYLEDLPPELKVVWDDK